MNPSYANGTKKTFKKIDTHINKTVEITSSNTTGSESFELPSTQIPSTYNQIKQQNYKSSLLRKTNISTLLDFYFHIAVILTKTCNSFC